ncbi:MAG TPA: hypothetical protein PLR25_15895 [Planctomycetaceae bacterium]|nr:hypothetical protein [Planctomycetaceae bacterium]
MQALRVLAAHDRYCEVRLELAEDFEAGLQRSREVIARSPQTWPAYLFGTQCYLMKRFPFFIVYRVTDVRIEIIAVAHERQRPGYWSDHSAAQ